MHALQLDNFKVEDSPPQLRIGAYTILEVERV